MTTTHSLEEDALHAYLQLLRKRGANNDNLERRKEFLLRLIPYLKGQQQDSIAFRDAVDDMLEISSKESWPFILAVAREYFPFWTHDIKAITSLYASGGLEVEPAVSEVSRERLKHLWKNIDTEKFSVTEKWPLKAYSAALREEGADKTLVETRTKLIKLLLVRLRDVTDVAGENGKRYRIAVDSLLSLFVMKEMRYLFLAVVREFYYFWVGDPDAASHILMDAPDK